MQHVSVVLGGLTFENTPNLTVSDTCVVFATPHTALRGWQRRVRLRVSRRGIDTLRVSHLRKCYFQQSVTAPLLRLEPGFARNLFRGTVAVCFS